MGEVGAGDIPSLNKELEKIKGFNNSFDICFGILSNSDFGFVKKTSDGERIIGVGADLSQIEGLKSPEILNKFLLQGDNFLRLSLFEVEGIRNVIFESRDGVSIKLTFPSLKQSLNSKDLSSEIFFSSENSEKYPQEIIDKMAGEYRRKKNYEFSGMGKEITDFMLTTGNKAREMSEKYRIIKIEKKFTGGKKGVVRKVTVS